MIGPQRCRRNLHSQTKKTLTRCVGDVQIEPTVGTKAGDALAISKRAAVPAGGASSHFKGARPKL